MIIVESDPGEEIARLASAYRVNLIVMSSRRRPVAAALLGSTAEAVCRIAPCPVLVVHPNEREFVGATTCDIDLRRILIAHDFSNDSELALQYALLLAQENRAELHLLHMLPVTLAPAVTALPAGVEDGFQRAARLLHQAVPSEAHLWCGVKQAVRPGQPYREILDYAEENEIDLICLGVHGTGLRSPGERSPRDYAPAQSASAIESGAAGVMFAVGFFFAVVLGLYLAWSILRSKHD